MCNTYIYMKYEKIWRVMCKIYVKYEKKYRRVYEKFGGAPPG